MTVIELIEKKRDGQALTANEILWVVSEYAADRVPDYQMAALTMAIFLQGMNAEELAVFTDAMLNSGEVLDFSHVAAPKVDKHSTGGVGDKVSIPLAPMVAACGVAVPMMSGRGLGHTGGTLDKLESIPGFRVRLDPSEFRSILEHVGYVMGGQSETLVPADRRLYALRDATGTVPSIPLIASSIMSKKMAEGLDALVLDVKVGRGAFMKDEASARELAETMVGIGEVRGTDVTALLTDMSQPLGREVGNANEIVESIATLRGEGPPDLTEVVYRLGAEMLMLGGIASDQDDARTRLDNAVASGEALDRFRRLIIAQDGDPAVLDDPDRLPRAARTFELRAEEDGFVTRADALDVGVAAVRLGAGRERKEDAVDHAVGITVHAKVGDEVSAGDVLATVAHNTDDQLAGALPVLTRAWEIGHEAPDPLPLILGEVR